MNALTSKSEFELAVELRAGSRASAFLLAFLEVEGTAFPVCLRNLSTAGALVEAEAGFPIGARVTFRRAFAAVPAKVVWSRGGRFGIAFDQRLAQDDVISLSRRIAAKAN